jgi:hypothetical protein
MMLRRRFSITLDSYVLEAAIGAFCLLIPALYNGFPLVTADSGGYISNSYSLYIPMDRPVGYSLFMGLSQGRLSLWTVVVGQALIVSGLLRVLAIHFLGGVYKRSVFFAIMLALGAATSAGWTCGQLTPDIFTPILLLTIGVLIYVPCDKPEKFALWTLVFASMLIHSSNLMIGILLALCMLVWKWRREALRRFSLMLLGVCVLSWLSLSTMTAIAGRGFRPSSSTHVFIMSRMAENGILDTYLREYCPTENYSLCAYRGKIPDRQWGFMWGYDGPFYATGGWEHSEKEYARLIRNTLTKPKYLAMHMVKNLEATMRQLPLIQVGDELAPLPYGTSPFKAIDEHNSHQIKEYASALQQHQELGLGAWNRVLVPFQLALCVALLLCYSSRRAKTDIPLSQLRSLINISLLFILLNAMMTATFATVVARYEARLFWVLPFFSILYIIRLRQLKTADTTISEP